MQYPGIQGNHTWLTGYKIIISKENIGSEMLTIYVLKNLKLNRPWPITGRIHPSEIDQLFKTTGKCVATLSV